MNWRRLAILVVAVALSQLLLWWLEPQEPPTRAAGPPRSGYALVDFRMQVLTSEGRIGFSLKAPHLQQRNSDGSFFIKAPRFSFPGNDASQWHGHAQRGWVSAAGDLLKLSGDVRLERPPDTHIRTSNITAWPEAERLATKARAEIRQPGRILSGTGLKADFADHTLELLADVHGTFQPATTD